MYRIKEAEFLVGVSDISQAPVWGWPEIAVVGRSNVGKSTFINRLTSRRGLARTSSTPGRTKEINFFRVVLLDEEDDERIVILVDLPGFGFSRVSKSERDKLHSLVAQYIDMRDSLSLMCLLNDTRRLPEGEEIEIRNIAYNLGRQILVVLTKTDKLKDNTLKKQVLNIASGYGLEAGDVVQVGSGSDMTAVWRRILAALPS